jgi:hypothetical protein
MAASLAGVSPLSAMVCAMLMAPPLIVCDQLLNRGSAGWNTPCTS